MKTQLKFEKEYDRYRSFDTKYRVLLEQCGSAFILVDEKGQVIDFNKKAATLLEESELNKIALENLFNQGLSTDILNELDRLNKSNPPNALTITLKKHNKELQMLYNIYIVSYNNHYVKYGLFPASYCMLVD